jgi:hypothetical protein
MNLQTVADELRDLLGRIDAELAPKEVLIGPNDPVQSILQSAPVGLPIRFTAGTYGPLLLPPHNDPWRVVRADPGVEFITTRGAVPAVWVTGSNYGLTGFVAKSTGLDGAQANLFQVGYSDATTLDQQAMNVTFINCWSDGQAVNGQKRGFCLQGGNVILLDCKTSNIKLKGMEAQGICSWNGPGPFLITNCYVEGSAQSIMFGGSDPKISGLVPSDITIRNTMMTLADEDLPRIQECPPSQS